MTSPEPFFKIRSDRFEVLQGKTYVSIDRGRVDAVGYHAGVLTAHYRGRGEVAIDCREVDTEDLKNLLGTLQMQRDRNHEVARRERKKNSGSILSSLF
jgi:hypothetical protein